MTALNDVNLVVPEGSVTTLLGPSGCGKTTLLRCIAGLETPDSGSISIGNKVVWTGTGGKAATFVTPDKRGIGMVFQTYAIWPHMSVFDNVAYPLESERMPRQQIAEKVARALEFVQLAGYERRPATALSGGQQQRVSLARAIVAEPDVILFDEPLSNLDAKLREETRAELRKLLTTLAITSLYVTHDRFEAMALSDDVVVMRSGNIVQRGAPKEIYFEGNSRFVVDFMGKANFLPGTVRAHENGHTLVDTPVGRLECVHDPTATPGTVGTVAIRSEFVHAGPRGSAAPPTADTANRSTGVVVSALFLGEYQEVEVDAGGQRLLLRVDATIPLADGDEVDLRFEPAACRFITE